jgi:hypothetical protein
MKNKINLIENIYVNYVTEYFECIKNFKKLKEQDENHEIIMIIKKKLKNPLLHGINFSSFLTLPLSRIKNFIQIFLSFTKNENDDYINTLFSFNKLKEIDSKFQYNINIINNKFRIYELEIYLNFSIFLNFYDNKFLLKEGKLKLLPTKEFDIKKGLKFFNLFKKKYIKR